MSENLPLPEPLYPCEYCCDDYSWPAKDLQWSEKVKTWVCDNCWRDEDHGKPCAQLSSEIKRQTKPEFKPIAEAPKDGRYIVIACEHEGSVLATTTRYINGRGWVTHFDVELGEDLPADIYTCFVDMPELKPRISECKWKNGIWVQKR